MTYMRFALALYVYDLIQVDVDLAKQNASKPEDDEELRKKLWLRIGENLHG